MEAIAAAGEKIVATGTTAEIRKLIGAKTRVIDLHGGFAMPGFNDAHLHLGSAAQAKVDGESGRREIARPNFKNEFAIAWRNRNRANGLTGRGWDHTLWSPANFPTRQDLDAISRDHPMLFTHISGHVAVANSKALEIAGITAATPNPPGARN